MTTRKWLLISNMAGPRGDLGFFLQGKEATFPLWLLLFNKALNQSCTSYLQFLLVSCESRKVPADLFLGLAVLVKDIFGLWLDYMN